MNPLRASRIVPVLACATVLILSSNANAQTPTSGEWLCDSSQQNCRTPLLDLIRNETVGIDVAFWFMEDRRFVDALIARATGRDGRPRVPVRVLVDTKANTPYPLNVSMIAALANAVDSAGGKPIQIRRFTFSYLHWKHMIFAGQNVVQFGSANYTPTAFVPIQPGVNFIDETIYFTNDAEIVNTFKRKFDDAWISTRFADYANVLTPLVRNYPEFTPMSSSVLNFPTASDYGLLGPQRYDRESPATGGIDVLIFRLGDPRQTDGILRAIARGVPIRFVSEERQYRDPVRYLHPKEVDRIYTALPADQKWRMRVAHHEGDLHQKTVLLRDQQMAIFGSQNWTTVSGNKEYEHNYFATKPWIYQWFRDQFEAKWSNESWTRPFVPLPPDAPAYREPANAGSGLPATRVTLRWYAGPWAWKYDIYFGTSATPPLFASNVELGPSIDTSLAQYRSFIVTGLQPNTTYYWKVVSKTAANLSRAGAVWNFRTVADGSAPTTPENIVLWASKASPAVGNFTIAADATAAGGQRIGNANAGVKVSTALAAPANYFEMTFNADAGLAYRLWIRGKAIPASWSNDSVYVQFSDSVSEDDEPIYRMGSTAAAVVTIEDCTSCGLEGWGWNDNATDGTAGTLGPAIFFSTTGRHTIRVQTREDGLWIDQIVLSRGLYLNVAPGATKNDGTLLPESIDAPPPPPPPPPPALPAGWVAQDIGSVGVAGTSSATDGTFTIKGAGADVWGTADALHYANVPLAGDGSITARVVSLSGSQAWVKVGVMIRSSASAGAAQAFMLVSKSKGLAFQRRLSDAAVSLSTAGPTGTAPAWVRLTRTGSTITASTSTNGTTWTTVGSDTFTMPANVLVGLATSSHSTSELSTGVFDNVTISSTAPTP